jgi:UPF0176 protein
VSDQITVISFYKFVNWGGVSKRKKDLESFCKKRGILGTVILANEGINATISGRDKAINEVVEFLKADTHLHDLKPKYSYASGKTFARMKVKIKKEIVTMGVSDINPSETTGEHINNEQWNALINDPNTLVIDTRNQYEYSIGTFKNAINPETNSFREFPKWIDENLEELMIDKKRVAMFCTGGIRCEKGSSLMIKNGCDDVYQLDGGVIKYLEEVNEGESLWDGECFVFDDRVSIKQGLLEGNFSLCHACRMPINEKDIASDEYAEGISCPNCYGTHSEDRKKRFSERQKQIKLAKERGEKHIGKTFKTNDA